MKRTIRLTESELRRMISKSVKSVLKESNNQPDYELMAYLDKLSKDLNNSFAALAAGDIAVANCLMMPAAVLNRLKTLFTAP